MWVVKENISHSPAVRGNHIQGIYKVWVIHRTFAIYSRKETIGYCKSLFHALFSSQRVSEKHNRLKSTNPVNHFKCLG